jgi:hypothetical protein
VSVGELGLQKTAMNSNIVLESSTRVSSSACGRRARSSSSPSLCRLRFSPSGHVCHDFAADDPAPDPAPGQANLLWEFVAQHAGMENTTMKRHRHIVSGPTRPCQGARHRP